ncbi:MAG: High-affinity branched-chain amino acid transport ATP-binding protein LivF [Nocardioidaceae bacterium]|nr:High-affinity branched-chain amino acid transport ATP-binding protein LivF [Nocardioidaceae bacterium]
MTDLLVLDGVSSGYGDLVIDRDISFTVRQGTITVLLGPNGAGKTTLLRTIAGLNAAQTGSIHMDGADVTRQPPYRRQAHGIGLVQENKRIFKRLTVEQNIAMGGYGTRLSRSESAVRTAEAFDWFPALAAKRDQAAGFLSGGQQQMVAIAQAMVSHPSLLMLDEPFSGLAPSIVRDVMDTVKRIGREGGRTLLLVEQAVDLALSMADDVLLLDLGRLVHTAPADEPGLRERVTAAYFGATL